MSKKEEVLRDIETSTRGLRQALFDEINGLRKGTTSIQRANTVHKLAMEIIHITKLELDYIGKDLPTSIKKLSLE